MVDSSKRYPDEARKLPQQSRSVTLLNSLKEACERILQDEGHKALTVSRLCEVSGVARGSIYQYVPNIEALIALVYEDRINSFLEERFYRFDKNIESAPPEKALYEIIDDTIYFFSTMYDLDPGFVRSFPDFFDFRPWADKMQSSEGVMTDKLIQIFDKFNNGLTKKEKHFRSQLIIANLLGAVSAAIQNDPARIKEPEFSELVFKMILPLFHVQEELW